MTFRSLFLEMSIKLVGTTFGICFLNRKFLCAHIFYHVNPE
jgi:hypothetical protein